MNRQVPRRMARALGGAAKSGFATQNAAAEVFKMPKVALMKLQGWLKRINSVPNFDLSCYYGDLDLLVLPLGASQHTQFIVIIMCMTRTD